MVDAFDLGYPEDEVNFSDAFSSEEQVTAPEYPLEGIYHMVVGPVDSSGRKWPGAVFFDLEILAGNVEGQAGKIIQHSIWPPSDEAKNQEKAKLQWQKTVLQLMLALGIRKAGEFPSVKFTDEWWASLEGRQMMAKVTHKEVEKKLDSGKTAKWIKASIARRDHMWPLGAEEVSEVQVDTVAAQAGGYLPSAESEGDI